MNKEQKAQVLSYIEKLVMGTRDKTLNWAEANPTTFVWVNKDNGGRIALQQLPTTAQLSSTGVVMLTPYMLQGIDQSSAVQLVLQGSEDKDINTRLDELFEVIKNIKTQNSIDFLGSIIPSS